MYFYFRWFLLLHILRMSFENLGVCSEIVELLKDKGIFKPTDVQMGCIPLIIEGIVVK